MDNALHMREIQRRRQIVRDPQRLVQRQSSAMLDDSPQSFSFDIFKDGIRFIVVKTEIINRRDSLMVEIGA